MYSGAYRTRYFTTALFALLMMANIEAYVLTISSFSNNQRQTLLHQRLTQNSVFSEQKGDSSEELNIEAVQRFAVAKLNDFIKEAGFEPKASQTFQRKSDYEDICLHPPHFIRIWSVHYTTSCTYKLETTGSTPSDIIFSIKIDASKEEN